jgi:hypothetical protein
VTTERTKAVLSITAFVLVWSLAIWLTLMMPL